MAVSMICMRLIPLLCLALLSHIAEGGYRHGRPQIRGGGHHAGHGYGHPRIGSTRNHAGHGNGNGRRIRHARHGTTKPLGTIFNVLKYGAKADGRRDSTEGFMQAWVAACHWRGPARLLIPRGTFLVGPVVFQGPCSSPTPIVVEVKGTVKATTDISEFSSPEWFSFESINGLIVTGGGTFDGQGQQVWKYNDCHGKSNCQMLPTSLKFKSVTNGQVRGIHSINSMGFHMAINRCRNFRAQNLRIFAPQDSPNTDGIHISSSDSIKVLRSVIGTGDDCISLGQGATNVFISGITCGPGHGISVGSLGKYQDEEDVRGVTVMNCTLLKTENGVRIKTWPDSPPSKASGFHFEDIIMDNVKKPIIIDQAYCPSSSCSQKPSRVQISDVHYRNIRGTSSSDSAVSIMCSPQYPCQNVELFNINLRPGGIKGGATAKCANAKLTYGGTQVPPPCL